MESQLEEEPEYQEENESSEEEINSEDEQWCLNYKDEKEFWNKTILKDLIYKPELYPKCHKNTFTIFGKKIIIL